MHHICRIINHFIIIITTITVTIICTREVNSTVIIVIIIVIVSTSFSSLKGVRRGRWVDHLKSHRRSTV